MILEEFTIADVSYGKPGNARPAEKHPFRFKRGQKFLKGPIPWEWLSKAATRPGKALHVAIVVWHLANLNRSRTIKLSGKRLREFGVNRYSAYRGLRQMQRARLVKVIRHSGRLPIVTILTNFPINFGAGK
jgi:hypothetical protein